MQRRVNGRLLVAVVWAAIGVVGLGQTGAGRQAPAPQLGLAFRPAAPASYAVARAAGVRAVKVLADWSIIESQRGQAVWADLDRALASVTEQGLAPVIVLAHTPRWASVGSGVDLARPEIYSRQPPRDIRDWERFVGAAAERYRGRVAAWQVWTQLGLPHFRGTGSEYLGLLRAARARLRAVDPASGVAMATPAGIDLGFILRVAQDAPGAFDAIVLAPHGFAPEHLLRPLAVLGHRLRPAGKAIWLDWTPGETADEAGGGAGGAWARMFAVAHAGGVDRIFVSDPSHLGAALRQAAAAVLTRPFVGYLPRGPDVYAVMLGGGADATLIAWTTAGARSLDLPGEPAPRAVGLDGRTVAVDVEEGRRTTRLGPAPIMITGVPAALVDESRAAAAARGPLVPPVSPERDYSRSAEVWARLGRVGEERGLYNLPFRARPNGAVDPVEVGGVEAVQTSVARQVIYVYFDIDDTFMYFVEGRIPVEIVVEVWGATAPAQVGFNILYDSTSGYRFTPWQWVGVGEGWVTHTIRLSDASMANTWGYDFAINTAGNRGADLIVRSVVVRKGAR
jgi:hypothetical protein